MASTTFIDRQTVIPTEWLQDVNDHVYVDDVTGYLQGTSEFIENDTGMHDTTYDVAGNVAKNTWETFGRTDSGEDNEWAALDDVPSGAKWVEISCLPLCSNTNGVAMSIILYGRKNGSTSGTTGDALVGRTGGTATGSGGTLYSHIGNMSTKKIPVDSNGVFELYWTSTGTTIDSIDIYLVGWGV